MTCAELETTYFNKDLNWSSSNCDLRNSQTIMSYLTCYSLPCSLCLYKWRHQVSHFPYITVCLDVSHCNSFSMACYCSGTLSVCSLCKFIMERRIWRWKAVWQGVVQTGNAVTASLIAGIFPFHHPLDYFFSLLNGDKRWRKDLVTYSSNYQIWQNFYATLTSDVQRFSAIGMKYLAMEILKS